MENNKLNEISERTKRIEEMLSKIDERLNQLEQDTSKMNNHINFVESVYDVVRKPFVSLLKYYSDDNKIKTLEYDTMDYKYIKVQLKDGETS